MDKQQEFRSKAERIRAEMTFEEQNNILLQSVVDQNYCIIDQLSELNEKKQQQIDNQKQFEGKWSRFKVIAATFAIGTPLISLLTGIIDPAVDMPILAERANAVLSQVYRFFGG